MSLGLLAQSSVNQRIATPAVDWWGLMPLVVLAAPAMVLLHLSSLVKRFFTGFFAIYTVVVALVAAGWSVGLWWRVTSDDPGRGPFSTVAGLFGVDGFSVFVTIVLFLGLEVLSLAVYILAAMHVRRAASQEAGMKYFVLGAFSSAFLLYGIALVYGATGSTNLIDISAFFAGHVLTDNALLLAGFGLVLVGLGFKVAAVPFHSWSPDVYQGSPSPVVAYMASGVKAAGFAGIVRVFVLAFGTQRVDWQPIVYVLAVATLVVGTVLAVVQDNVKRMMAYSSISHAGFILVGIEAATSRGTAAVLYYLAAYTFMIAGTFGVITLVGRRGDARHQVDDYRGLAREQPLLALTFTVFLLAQTGVPLTSGFFAKFGVILAAVDAGSYWLAIVAMAMAVVAAFVYLRLIVAMYMSGDVEHVDVPAHVAEAETDVPAPTGPSPASGIRVPAAAAVALALALGVTGATGVFPGLLQGPARDAVPVLVRP
jgi:NADH-quinone oxidoreductase subunit N